MTTSIPVLAASHDRAATSPLRRGWRRGALVGTAVALAGGASVGGLTDAAHEGDSLAALDPTVTSALVAARTPLLTTAAQTLSQVGSITTLLALTLLTAGLLAWRTRAWRLPALVLGAMAGSAALTAALKIVAARQRPDVALMLGAPDHEFAFPSGHTVNATVFFGLLGVLAVVRVRSRLARAAIGLGWLALTAAIAYSRVYLGYHWLTDVLAGWLLGVAWLAALMVVAGATGLVGTRRR